MSHISVDLLNLYQTYFGKPYTINPENYNSWANDRTTHLGIPLSKQNSVGREIFLPVRLWLNTAENIEIDCCTIRVTSKKTIIRTAVSERVGTIKEQFNVGDYVFNIKGVLIGVNRSFPDQQIRFLKDLYESKQKVELHNALTEIFLTELSEENRCPVAIESLEFPEREGGSIWHKPFSLVCETDFADTLIYTE